MIQYVALLRGINVGGKNLIRMTELKACLEAEGLSEVATYIQSGNVLFAAKRSDGKRLARGIEGAIGRTFHCRSMAVVRTLPEMRRIVEGAPDGFGARPARYRYDVVFLAAPLSAPEVVGTVPAKEGVDRAWAGAGVVYFSRLVSKLTQSRMSRVASMAIYKSMTIRNWNTTTKLLRMMEAREG